MNLKRCPDWFFDGKPPSNQEDIRCTRKQGHKGHHKNYFRSHGRLEWWQE